MRAECDQCHSRFGSIHGGYSKSRPRMICLGGSSTVCDQMMHKIAANTSDISLQTEDQPDGGDERADLVNRLKMSEGAGRIEPAPP